MNFVVRSDFMNYKQRRSYKTDVIIIAKQVEGRELYNSGRYQRGF